MDDKIDAADKNVLVDIVKLVQKRGMKGKLGNWKEFLNDHDKQFGSGLSDPAKRPHKVLADFLKTFSNEEDLKLIGNIMRHHVNQYRVEQLKDRSNDSPQQMLVQATLKHPLYSLDYSLPSIDEGWLVINLKNKSKGIKSTTMVAVDCEMVLCEDGTEALVKVCVVDHNLKVKLHKLVKPEKAIIDYRTEITGVSSKDLEAVTCSLANIQKSLKRLLSNGTILVGHSLYNDLRVLKLDYVRVIDTAYIFQPLDGSIRKRPSLNSLCQSVLGYEVRAKGASHDCLDDASATMKLVLARINHGVDKPFPLTLAQEPVPESAMSKLLVHRIPTTVNSEALHEIVPGDFTIERKPSRNGQGDMYSALAIFKNQQEAHNAFENVQGTQSKDTSGRLQKLVTCRLSTGMNISLFVRKMGFVENLNKKASKRDLQVEETDDICKNKRVKRDPEVENNAPEDLEVDEPVDDSNEGKVDPEIEALNQRLNESALEIESLKEQVRKKDFEIATLRKMASNIQEKQKPKKK